MRPVARLLLLSGMLVGAGCNDSPTEPSPVAPTYGLRAGDYTLTVSVASSSMGIPTSCLETTAAADRTAIPVIVQSTGRSWQVRPVAEADLGLLVNFESPGQNALVGLVEGAARDLGTGVTVTFAPFPVLPGFASLGPASLFGRLEADNVGGGTVNAQVRFSQGTGARQCSVHTWRLEPR